MNDPSEHNNGSDETELSRQVANKETRKLRQQRKTIKTIWFGFGMFGLIGWSVTIPTLAGIAVGLWLDKHAPGQTAWTLNLLIIGLIIGCWNAWHWLAKENKAIHDDSDDNIE